MKLFRIGVLVFFITFFSDFSAQFFEGINELSQNQIDSLWASWKDTTNKDIDRLNAIHKCRKYLLMDTSDLLEALTLSKSINDKKMVNLFNWYKDKLLIEDSLWSVWSDSTRSDTSRSNALILFSKRKSNSTYINLAYDFANSIKNNRGLADLWEYKYISIKFKGNDNNSEIYLMISYLKKALELYEATNNKKGMISSCNNLASEFFSISNFERAIFFNKKGIDISKKFSNLKSLAEFQSKLADVYVSQGNKEKAKYYYEQALMFKDYEYRPYILKRFAEFNETEKNYEKALDLYKSAIKTLEKNKEASASYSHYLGIGRVFSKMKDNKLALDYLDKALEKVKEEQVPIWEAQVYISFFEHYNRVNNDFQTSKYINKYLGIVRGKNYLTPLVKSKFAKGLFKVAVIEEARLNNKKALEYYLESKFFSKQALNLQYELETSQNLYNLYKKMGNYQKALQIHESYVYLKDTLAKIDGIQEDLNNELLQYFELENQADSIKHAEEIILHQANAKTQKQRSNGLVLISIIILVSLGLVFTQLKKVKKGKLLVEERNVVIEEKQKEITDSINYAKRLQDGILVPLDLVQSWLSESFILFKPKDIVSGDFYWIEKVGDKIYFAVADCTGHGIPGALVSIICSNALSKALQEDKISSPAKILDATRQLVEQRFVRATDSIKDGMDISLCCLNVKTKTITWAGAMNPLWVVKKDLSEVQELKPDRQAIGMVENPKPFTEHKLKLSVGDSVYLFSDGYPDQFGGPKGKKYMKGKMKKYVLSVQNQSMQEQLASFDKEFESWRGSQDQIDDVCVMGVRIT